MNTTHKKDGILFIALLLGLAIAPILLSQYSTVLLVPALAFGIALLGMNILFGYTGLLSFGHAMFLAVGAYVAAFATKLGITHFEYILIGAAIVGGIFALVVGALCVKFTHIFFGILTLAFGMLLHSFLFKFYNLTGGDQGMRIARPLLFGQEWNMTATQFLSGPFYYYSLIIYAILAWITWRIINSPLGVHLRAIRDNENKAQYLGVRVYQLRLFAFVVSGILGAIGGVLLGVAVGLADPEIAYWLQSGNLIFMMILGGSGVFSGPGIGALFFVLLNEMLVANTQYWRFFLGSALILLVIALPNGTVGTIFKKMENRTLRGEK